VQLLFQYHTYAAWISLVLFIPVVSTLLDAPMCALVLTRKSGCADMADYAPSSTVALILFIILAPLSGTAARFAFCHPTYSNSVDLRQKRTSTYVMCFAQTMIAAGWKVNGHDLPSTIGVSAVGLMALFAVHLFTQPCAYGNVNLFRQSLLTWPFAATIVANIMYFRGALQQACLAFDPLYVILLGLSFVGGIVFTIFTLRRAGQRASQLEAIVNPQSHRHLNVLRQLWSNIETMKMRLYNTPNSQARSRINLQVQEQRLSYLQELQRYRHAQEEEYLAEYYLGAGARVEPHHHGGGCSPSQLGSLDSIPMREAAKKEVTHADIEQLTQAQMASCTEGPVLGRGTYGVVHMAMLPGGKLVALKVVQVQKRHKSESIAAVRREVDVLRALRHPNIIQFHGCHVNKREIYIFMELATNGSLTQLAKKFGQLSERNIRHYTRQMLGGLQYLHARGIVHRDIKGENILIDGNGVAKLGDFGCSKALAEAANHSQEGCASLVGSPYWMAPEVIRSEAYGTKADVWSLGCTVVEMLNGGRPPWNETFDNVYSAMFFIGNSNGLPTSIPADITPACEAFLNRCFERDASSRASVAELLEDPWMNGDLSSDSSPTDPETTMMHRGWSELFESDSEGPASRGNTVPRQPTDSFLQESLPIETEGMRFSSTTGGDTTLGETTIGESDAAQAV
jgi:serine/threonine protein kinase